MPKFEITAFGPPEITSRRLQGRLLNLVQKYGKKIKTDLDSITLTWDHKPTFNMEERYAGGVYAVRVSTDDEIFGYLDEGTSKRWALMSKDFVPKTEIRTLNSFPGRGKAVLRGQEAMVRHGLAARPGIDAREWTLLFSEIHETNFQLDADEILREELGDYFNG